jgi:hypothetical protein
MSNPTTPVVTTTSVDELIKKCEAKKEEFLKRSGERGVNPHLYISNIIEPVIVILKRGTKPERVDEDPTLTKLREQQYTSAMMEAQKIAVATDEVIKVAVFEQPSPTMKPTHGAGEKIIKPVMQ